MWLNLIVMRRPERSEGSPELRSNLANWRVLTAFRMTCLGVALFIPFQVVGQLQRAFHVSDYVHPQKQLSEETIRTALQQAE